MKRRVFLPQIIAIMLVVGVSFYASKEVLSFIDSFKFEYIEKGFNVSDNLTIQGDDLNFTNLSTIVNNESLTFDGPTGVTIQVGEQVAIKDRSGNALRVALREGEIDLNVPFNISGTVIEFADGQAALSYNGGSNLLSFMKGVDYAPVQMGTLRIGVAGALNDQTGKIQGDVIVGGAAYFGTDAPSNRVVSAGEVLARGYTKGPANLYANKDHSHAGMYQSQNHIASHINQHEYVKQKGGEVENLRVTRLRTDKPSMVEWQLPADDVEKPNYNCPLSQCGHDPKDQLRVKGNGPQVCSQGYYAYGVSIQRRPESTVQHMIVLNCHKLSD